MNPNHKEKSSFHTDQGRWDRRDYENDTWNKYENDNISRNSLQGHRPDEMGEGEALDYHEDEPLEFQKEYPEQPVSHVYSDNELEKAVKELLRSSKQLHDEEIAVTACNGDVVLRGTVKSEEKRTSATFLTQLIHGVGQIRNDLIVKKSEHEPRSGYAKKDNNQEGTKT
jgi:hypothetical protein